MNAQQQDQQSQIYFVKHIDGRRIACQEFLRGNPWKTIDHLSSPNLSAFRHFQMIIYKEKLIEEEIDQ